MAPCLVNLNEALRRLHSMLQRVVGEDIVLTLEEGATLASIQIDPGQLEQVVMNLVVNARDAMPGGGKLTLRTEDARLDDVYAARHPGATPGPHVCFSVSDTGEGIDAATIERIFDPFFTTKDQGKGTGLGLSTVWGIVTQSGGTIAVSSAPGEGTRFDIHFPAVEQALIKPTASVEASQPAAGSETILVVEDEEQVRKLMCSVLRRAGYHVLEAVHGGDGLVVSRHHDGPIHLLLTDVIMPHMNGRELARELAQQRPQTRVLYISGYTENAMWSHRILDEAVTLLAKPIAPRELLREVRAALDRA